MSALIYCPFPDAESAEAVARSLMAEGLVACLNLGGAMRSVFAWNGEIQTGDEVPAVFKTDARLLDAAVARLETLHPYDAPAVMGWRCESVGAATRDWLAALGPA